MSSNKTTMIIASIGALLLAAFSGVAHGWLDGRWANKPNLTQIGDQLDQLPDEIGDWILVEKLELSDNVLNQLRCYGYTHRRYKNVVTGDQVEFAVLFGPRGPIAVHVPEICYSGQGVPSEDRERVLVQADGKKHSLWQVNFLTKNGLEPDSQVHYAWSDGGQWIASEHPRFWLTDHLYKIQISGPPQAESTETSPSESFLESLFPLLERSLKPTS